MEYSRTFSAVPGHFRKKRKNFLTDPIVYHEESVSTETLSKIFPNNTRYIRRPIYALIEITKSKIECKLEGLQEKLIPIPLVEQTFRVDIADILPNRGGALHLLYK